MKNGNKNEKKNPGGRKMVSELDKLIPQYAMNKNEADAYKKLCDKENAQIKALMADLDNPVYETGGYKATYSVSTRESMNEDKLLEIAHIYGITEIVKTKEYIDFDILEDAIYKGRISEDILMEMNKAREVKEVVTLRVTKIKEKKNG